mgnify:CR=1 FL=1
MMRSALSRGSCAAIAAALAAYAASRWGLHRLYYLGVLLPSLAFLFLLVAWLLHLKDDGFFRAPKRAGKEEAPLGPFAPRGGLVPVLLVAAAELALLATALYAFIGVGAHYY